MKDIRTISLPISSPEYNRANESQTRRIIEQTIADLNNKITKVEQMQSTVTSKASKRHQFLLMGMKHG